MDAILARLAQLEERALTQDTTIADLSCQLEAQATSHACLASDNARLTLNVAYLLGAAQEHALTIRELGATVSPGGYWMWEASSGPDRQEVSAGRWVWSHEKYAATSSITARADLPPASFDTLPKEILDMILALVDRSDFLAIGGVCYRCLAVVSPMIYSKVSLNMKAALLLVKPRVSALSRRSPRISRLLAPLKMDLKGASRNDALGPLELSILSSLAGSTTIDITTLGLKPRGVDIAAFLRTWTPILRLLNPTRVDLVLWASSNGPVVPPTQTYVATQSFAIGWDRLRHVWFGGPGSFLVDSSTLRPSVLSWFDRSITPVPALILGFRLKGDQSIKVPLEETMDKGTGTHFTDAAVEAHRRAMIGRSVEEVEMVFVYARIDKQERYSHVLGGV